MFNFLTENCKSFLDLGCGFGRFLHFLNDELEDPDYIGYDSSDSMIQRIKERFPEYFPRFFLRDVTSPITHPQEGVLISAVLVHLARICQDTILENLKKINPKPLAITFDINSPPEVEIDRLKIKRTDHFERYIKTTNQGTSHFRMTWQDHSVITSYLIRNFPDYHITVKFYDLKQRRNKVVYFLLKKGIYRQV